MPEYNDERYLKWCKELQSLVSEFLDTDGNTEESLEAEVQSAIENAKE